MNRLGGKEGYSPAHSSERARTILIGVVALLGCVILAALGTWQLERRTWKLNLIQQIETRVHAAPAPAPGPQKWAQMNGSEDAYRRVRVHGVYMPGKDTFVQASTERGFGSWVLTPLRTDEGWTVLVNRGFLSREGRKAEEGKGRGEEPPSGGVTVTGLLRTTEPGGMMFRANDPAADRWYSRDVAAIAVARSLSEIAPYFIDADATLNAPGAPIGGLTRLAFPNNHLVYALTWYALAAMLAYGAVLVVRESKRERSDVTDE